MNDKKTKKECIHISAKQGDSRTIFECDIPIDADVNIKKLSYGNECDDSYIKKKNADISKVIMWMNAITEDLEWKQQCLKDGDIPPSLSSDTFLCNDIDILNESLRILEDLYLNNSDSV